ncbi:MAG: efflux RND transporter permease subunit, partial [Acidobacteria bacterium]|nr:efflux RND transporter permease subunit [Acidobacteriota bacterium]
MKVVTRLSLMRPMTVYVLLVIVLIGGVTTYLSLPRESFPEIKVPFIIVSTLYVGTSPADMESQVTRKIETELKGVSGVKEIRSSSLDGYSLIEVEFSPDVDLDTALQKVREKVDLAKPELPEDVEDPVVQDFDFSRIPIMIVNLSANFGMARLKEIADDVKDDLEAIPGVNLVEIVGGRDREVQVFVDPRRMVAHGVGFVDVEDAIRREHITVPGGDIDIGALRFLVRTPAEVRDPREIESFVVDDRGGRPVLIRDVATVVYGFEDEATRARVNRASAISLTVEKRTGANIIEVADAVHERLASLEQELPGTLEITVAGDQSDDIRDMVHELQNNIISGLLLVLLILFLTMGWRPAVIVALAIPLSMLLTFIALALFGYTLNMVVLFSMVLVLGMLVDNAIVTVENIYRHRELGDSPFDAALAGASEVAIPITTSTLTTLAAFAPLLFWPGITGEFMKYLPITLIMGLTASLFVALVFNPAQALALFRSDVAIKRVVEPGRLTLAYRALLAWALDHRLIVLGAILAVFVCSIVAYGALQHGVEFFPDTDPRSIYVDMEFPPGTNLEAQNEVVAEIERRMADIPDLKEMVANVGSTGIANDGSSSGGRGSSNVSRVTLNLERYFDRSQSSAITMDEVRRRASGFSGVRITVDKPQDGPPTGKPVSIRVKGDDYALLSRVSEELVPRLQRIPGMLNVDDDFDAGNPEIAVHVDREKAARARTNTREVALAVRDGARG